MGLSMYRVCRDGASNPVNHISLTMAILRVSLGSFNRSPSVFLLALFRTWGWKFKGSEEEPVITTFITPSESSALCQSGLIFCISWYRSTHILLLIQTIIALPSNTAFLASKCYLPHLDIKLCLSDSSSFSVSSSNSASTLGFSSSLRIIFANLFS